MAKKESLNDEEIIAALLQSGSVREAATKTGITERTIYNKLHDSDFRKLYTDAKADILRQAVISINGKLYEAIGAVADIMNDKDNNAAVRLQAAQTIINNAAKLSGRLDHEEEQAKNSIFDLW